MPDVDRREYVQLRDSIAETRRRIIGLPYVKLAANSVARTQEIRGLGFTEPDAKWLASLPPKTLDAILPTADAIAISRDHGLDNLAGLVRVLAAQCNPPVGVPADFGGAADSDTSTAARADRENASTVVRVA